MCFSCFLWYLEILVAKERSNVELLFWYLDSLVYTPIPCVFDTKHDGIPPTNQTHQYRLIAMDIINNKQLYMDKNQSNDCIPHWIRLCVSGEYIYIYINHLTLKCVAILWLCCCRLATAQGKWEKQKYTKQKKGNERYPVIK